MIHPKQTNIGFQDKTPPEVVEHLKSHFAGKVVCDIGTGTGELLELISKHASEVKGIEKSEQLAEISNNKSLNVIVGDASKIDIPQADVYYLWATDPNKIWANIIAKDIKGTFIIGLYNDYIYNQYFDSVGTKEVVKTTRGDFTVHIIERK